jgi:AcrR family transcriptional regulator
MPQGPSEGGQGRRRRIRGLDAEERRAQRRGLLLDAALDQIAARGYHNTSIEQICRAAGVSTKSFYECFESREACYLALLQRTTDRIAAHMVERLQQAPTDERAATPELLAAFAHALVDDPRFALATFGAAAGVSPAVERQRRVNRRWAAGFLEELWKYYGAIGPTVAVGQAHNVAIGAIGGMFDLVADWLQDSDPADPLAVDSLIRRLTDFYLAVRSGLGDLRLPPHSADRTE